MQLEFRVRKTGMATTPYILEKFDEKRRQVVSTRPASEEEWTLYCLAMRRLP